MLSLQDDWGDVRLDVVLLVVLRDAVQQLELPLGEEMHEEDFADDHKGRHEEGEDDGRLLHGRQPVEDPQAPPLEEGVGVDAAGGQLLHVVELGVGLGVPDAPEEEALEEAVAVERGHAHEEEDPEEHGLRNVLQRGREGQGESEEHVDQHVAHALLADLLGHLPLALWELLHGVGGEGHEVREAGHRGGHGQGQAQQRADGRADHGAHEEIEVVAGGLLQLPAGPVHEHRRQVLVKVAQEREPDGRHDPKEDRPDREVAVRAEWAHDPASRLAVAEQEGWADGARDVEHVDLDVPPDGREPGCGRDREADAEVREPAAEHGREPRRPAEACELRAELVGHNLQD
mmetsp:Transcript_104535/g.327076  ORF Transcript_104535/g.327076 Transcript_104535/m.327076 type:complete len:345 (-) Transcript_104535:794-1828(-)